MPIWFLKILQKICLFVSVVLIVVTNFINYYLEDDRGQIYRNIFLAIAWVMFLLMAYVWINESIKRDRITTIISGWAALYLLINLGVVMLGYNLYTRGVIEMFIITTLAGISHIGIRLWQR